MSGFKLSPQVDANKVFLVQRAQLEGRIDPHQYHHERLSAIAALRKANQVVPLCQMVRNAKQITTEMSPSDIYIGLENIASDTGEYVATTDKQSISSAGVFKKGQILFPKLRPYLNKVHLAEFDGLCSTEFHIFKTNEMDAEFLAIYLRSRLVVNQTRHLMTGNTLPRLQTEDINRLPVPLLPLEKQRQIVSFYNQANQFKQQKEQQAATLLASIDGYLLGELGITLPQQDNSLEKRMFRVSSREVEYRLDPYYFQSHFIDFFEVLGQVSYPIKPVKHLAKKITSGITPLSGGDAYTTEQEGVPFIRSGNINIDGSVDFSDLLYLESDVHNGVMKSSKLLKNDLMIAIVGATIGQVGIYLDDREANINQAIALVRLQDDINPQYVKELIKSSIGQMCLNRLKRPVARANINLEEISTLPIILLPFDKQNEIVAHIQAIRTQASQLQTEAMQILSDAKAQVERMILGEG